MEKRFPPPFLSSVFPLTGPSTLPAYTRKLGPMLPIDKALPTQAMPQGQDLCQAVLRDDRYYAAKAGTDTDRHMLSLEIRQALEGGKPPQPAPGDQRGLRRVTRLFEDEARAIETRERRRLALDADSAILAQALALARATDCDVGKTSYRQAHRLLRRLRKTDLRQAIRRQPPGKTEREKPIWRAILFLASSPSGMDVLRKICPWPDYPPDTLAIFLKAGARLMLSAGDACQDLPDLLKRFPDPGPVALRSTADADQDRHCRTMHVAYKALVGHDVGKCAWMDLLKANNGLDSEQEKSVADILGKLPVWCKRSLVQESIATRLFDATLRKAFAPATKKKLFGALANISPDNVDKPGATPSGRLRLAAQDLCDKLHGLGARPPGKDALRRLLNGQHAKQDAELSLAVRRSVLDRFLRRRYALLDGTRLNEREIREIGDALESAWKAQLSDKDFRYSLPTQAQLARWRKRIDDLIRDNAGPLGMDRLQAWADRLNADFPRQGGSRHESHAPERLFPALPTRQELADVLNDLTARLERGGSYRFSSNGTFRFSIAPVTEIASGALTGGLVAITVDAGIASGKEAVCAVERTADGLELFIGRERIIRLPVAIEARSGASACFVFQASAGARVSAAYCRRDREGVLIRYPFSGDKTSIDTERRNFGELVGKLVMRADDREPAYDWLLQNYPQVTVSLVGGRDSNVSASAELSASASLTGRLLEAQIGASLQGGSKTSVTRTAGHFSRTQVSSASRAQLSLGASVSGMAIKQGQRLLSRHGANSGEISAGKTFHLTEKPNAHFQVTEAGGQTLRISRKHTYRNRDAFIQAVRHGLPLAVRTNEAADCFGTAHNAIKNKELEQFLHEAETEDSEAAYEIDTELKPHALQLLNRFRAIAANARHLGNIDDVAAKRRITALLEQPDTWRMRTIAKISARKKDQRSGISLLSFFYGERKEAFAQRFSEMVSIPGSSEYLASPNRGCSYR